MGRLSISLITGAIPLLISESLLREITPGIVPITQDIGIFARRLKATLGEEERDRIRNTVINIESLTSELDGFVKGYIQLTADQQPFMQGYLPVLSLCQREVLGLGAITQNTGNGFVTLDNYESVMELANAGLR